MKGIEYKFQVNGTAMSFWKGGDSKTIIFATGFPQYVTPYHPFVLTLVSLGYNLLVPKYKGSWESDGVFGVKTSIESIEDALQIARFGRVTELFGNTEIEIPNKEILLLGFSYGGLVSLLTETSGIKKILLMPFLNLKLHGKEELERELLFVEMAYRGIYKFDSKIFISELESVKYPEAVSNISLVVGSKDTNTSKTEIDWFLKKYLISVTTVEAGHSANLLSEQFKQFL